MTENIRILFPQHTRQTGGKNCQIPPRQLLNQENADIIGLEIEVAGENLEFRIAVRPVEIGLADILPLAGIVSDKITQKVLEKVYQQGRSVPCSPGCSTCCHYLVPLSVPEALYFADLIRQMPESHQKLVQRLCLVKAKQILKNFNHNFFDKTIHSTAHKTPRKNTHPQNCRRLSEWYKELNLSCPFLCDGICAIYKFRPLACREYYVTGSKCDSGRAQVLQLPVRMPEILAQLAGELEGLSPEAVMLPLVILWHQHNSHRKEQKWPAGLLASRFARIVKHKITENTAPATL